MLISPTQAITLFEKQNTYCILIGNHEELILILKKYIQKYFSLKLTAKPDQQFLFENRILIESDKLLPYDADFSYIISLKYLSPENKKTLNSNVKIVNCYEDNDNLKLVQIQSIAAQFNLTYTKNDVAKLMLLSHLNVENNTYFSLLKLRHKNIKKDDIQIYSVIYSLLKHHNIYWFILKQQEEGFSDISSKHLVVSGLRKLIEAKLNIHGKVHFKDEAIFKSILNEFKLDDLLYALKFLI